MKGVLHIVTIAGIPVQVHWSFGLMFFYVLYTGHTMGMGPLSTALFGVFMLTLFVCVVMHEFGHALSARRYGVKTKDIILSPIGGVARLEHLPEKPLHEFIIAIAGPLVNVAIALVLSPYFFFYSPAEAFPSENINFDIIFSNWIYFIPMLIAVNITLALFNLLPAFPMDGGRIFRSLLSMKFGRLLATRIASYLGKLMAILFIAFSFYDGSPMLSIIGLFVFFVAGHEYKMVKADTLLKEKKVSDIMQTAFSRISLTDDISLPMDILKKGDEKNFLVFDEWQRLVGVLTEHKLLEIVKKPIDVQSISDQISYTYAIVSPYDSLNTIYEKINEEGHRIFPVFEEGKLIAVIDINILNKYLKTA